SKHDKRINVQVKLPEELHNEFKEFTEKRSLSIQAAGLQAIEFWVAIQKEIGSYYTMTSPEDELKAITDDFHKAITDWSEKKKKETFKTDSFQKIIGMAKSKKELSKMKNNFYLDSQN
ncbi:MAG: hypothetical protein ACFFD1_11765, partial [Candidatus Thorarchaeota archaeon]